MYLGYNNTKVKKLYYQNQEVKKCYYQNVLVYNSTKPFPEITFTNPVTEHSDQSTGMAVCDYVNGYYTVSIQQRISDTSHVKFMYTDNLTNWNTYELCSLSGVFAHIIKMLYINNYYYAIIANPNTSRIYIYRASIINGSWNQIRRIDDIYIGHETTKYSYENGLHIIATDNKILSSNDIEGNWQIANAPTKIHTTIKYINNQYIFGTYGTYTRLYTSTDLINWTSHLISDSIYEDDDDEEARNRPFEILYIDNKYYVYCLYIGSDNPRISVLSSSSIDTIFETTVLPFTAPSGHDNAVKIFKYGDYYVLYFAEYRRESKKTNYYYCVVSSTDKFFSDYNKTDLCRIYNHPSASPMVYGPCITDSYIVLSGMYYSSGSVDNHWFKVFVGNLTD